MVFFTAPLSTITTKWRIFHEESADLNPRSERSDFEELRGAGDTRIYRHGQETLAVSSDSGRMQSVISRIPGVTSKNGSVFLFPDSLLDTVAERIRARYKRQYTPEQLEAAREHARLLQERRKSLVQNNKTRL